MAYTNPTYTDFQDKFDRDFAYATVESDMSRVRQKDINNAISDADKDINSDLFVTQDEYTTAFLLLTAHCLCTTLKSSSQGVSGEYTWLVNSKSVGSVSESFTIPERISRNPYFSWLSTTGYGSKYLSMIINKLVGNVNHIEGTTTLV